MGNQEFIAPVPGSDDGQRHAHNSVPSACEFLLRKCATAVWKRGEGYAETGKIEIVRLSGKEITAFARGTSVYSVRLAFSGGGISKQCGCPYSAGSKAQHAPCKHMIAVAILWDENRGLKRPSEEIVQQETIPPPKVSRAQINAVFDNPLNADLNILRIYVDESGRWSRPHVKLPLMPAFADMVSLPLTAKEIKKALSEMNTWTRRSNFDPYFCAGEMVAAFCDVLRLIDKRLAATDIETALDIFEKLIVFNRALMIGKIDTSDGVHTISETHLRKILATLNGLVKDGKLKARLEKTGQNIGEY